MAGHDFAVAIVGATSSRRRRDPAPPGRARSCPSREIRPLGSARTAGRELDVGTIGLVGPDAFRGIDLAFFAAGPTVAGEHALDAARAGATVIDTSSRFRLDDGVPLVVPGGERAAARSGEIRPTWWRRPSSTAIGLAVVLAPLAEAGGLRRVAVSTYQSAAGAGRRAVEHLSKESIKLLSGRGDDDVPVRRAFNCVPQIGTVEVDGLTSHERAVAAEVRKVLDLPSLAAQRHRGPSADVLRHGGERHDRARAAARPRGGERHPAERARGLLVHEDGEAVTLPTPADVVGSQATHVARVRQDPSVPNGLMLWLALDSIEKGAALNAVQIAEILMRRRGMTDGHGRSLARSRRREPVRDRARGHRAAEPRPDRHPAAPAATAHAADHPRDRSRLRRCSPARRRAERVPRGERGRARLLRDHARAGREAARPARRPGGRPADGPPRLELAARARRRRRVDVVVSGFAIHHLPDVRKRALYAEIFAALAPGGTFLNLEHVASATPGVEAIHDEAMVAFRATAQGADVQATRVAYHARPDKADNILAPVEHQCAWLREIGFVDVDVFWKWFELALFGGRTPCS